MAEHSEVAQIMKPNAQRLHDDAAALARRIEAELPASELATSIQVLLENTRNFLRTNGEYPQWPDVK